MRYRPFALLAALALLAYGCSVDGERSLGPDVMLNTDVADDAGADAAVDTSSLPSDRASVLVLTEPLRLQVTFHGSEILTLGDGDLPPFALVSEAGRADLRGPLDSAEDGDDVVLSGQLSDGRVATVRVGTSGEGAAEIQFHVADRSADEKHVAYLKVGPEEGFYGIMERVVQGAQGLSWRDGMTEALDLRGQLLELYVYPTIALYSPFFVSSAGYGVQVVSDWPGRYDFGTHDPELVSLVYEGQDLSLRVFPGPDPMAASARYAREVGTTLLPPRWAFGPWRWRDDVYDLPAFYDGTAYEGPYNSMIVEDILMMEALGIPCSLYWVDRPWAEGDAGYDDLVWDEQRLPQSIDMVAWLASRGIKFMLWLAPWAVGPEMYAEAVALGYHVENPLPGWPGAALIDFTNPDAVTWWQDHLIARIAEGVLGFKLDRSEEMNPDGLLFQGQHDDGRSYRELHNRYPQLYAAAVHGAFERAGVEEYVVMPRAGWVGTSQHAVVWGGDTGTSEWGLRSAIIAVQRAAVMNFPLWGSDTCGYAEPHDWEVCSRWLAFSAFTPLMEVGPTGNLAPWSFPADGEDYGVGASGYNHEPIYNAELLAVWNLYANLHAELADYSYAQARRAHEDGTPFVRPMVFAYPDRPEFKDLFDQFLYGPDILVAPVWKKGVTRRSVHIPNVGWVDAWTGLPVTAGIQEVDAPLHQIPLYVRADGSVDLGDLPARWEQAVAATAAVPDLGALAATMK